MSIKAKKVTPQYRLSTSNLVKAPGTVLLMKFADGSKHTVLLEGIMSYMKADREEKGARSVAGRIPEGVFLAAGPHKGTKIGAFPVIMALTEEAAEKMTEYLGYPIVPGDGTRLSTQTHALEVWMDLKRMGVRGKELHCEWMISDPMQVIPSFDPCI